MKKAIRRFTDLVRLWRIYKFKEHTYDYSKVSFSRVFKIAKHPNNIKDTTRRNLLAAILRRARAEYPYKPDQNYASAKKLYEEYFQMEGHIPDVEAVFQDFRDGKDVFLTVFRFDIPIKGIRWCEYYVNGGGWGNMDAPKTYKAHEMREVDKDGGRAWMYCEGVDGDTNATISNEDFTQWRFATEAEIKDWYARRTSIKALRQELDYHQKEKERLYAEISKIKNFDTDDR